MTLSSSRHRALASFWSMIFLKTGIHFSGSCSNQTFQRGTHACHDFVPIAALALAEQAQARVPRGVLALEQPAPVGPRAEHHPGGAVERAGNMRDGGIRGDQ